MLGYLSGKVLGMMQDQVIIKLPSGAGYLVHVPPSLRYLQNENLDLFILEVARENKVELYGFTSLKDREWVDKLLKVDGVGPKVAATVLYTLGYEKVLEAVQNTDTEILAGVKGLGLKTAKKIVLELKGGLTDLSRLDSMDNDKTQMALHFTETLSNLGYRRGEIVSVISTLKKQGSWDNEDLATTVKEALKHLGKK